MFDVILAGSVLLSVFLIAYHHVIFPWWLSRYRRSHPQRPSTTPNRHFRRRAEDSDLPAVTIVMPAYNEEAVIADKINILGTLDYPADKLFIKLVCDGCKDDTAMIARRISCQPQNKHLNLQVVECPINRGKVTVLNEAVTACRTPIVALSDVSALVSTDALLIAADHFTDPKVGVVAGTYRLLDNMNAGESLYWQYQLAIKQSEAALGAPMGVHGAFYLFRRELFAPLPLDTINDDFILPMEIVAQGYHARYDTQIMALELEPTSEALERSRRRRIAAGNLQQTLRLAHLLHPRHGGIALLFGSGKALRALMPFILLFTFFASGYLAIDYPYWRLFFALQVALYGLVAFLQLEPALAKKPLMQTLQYLVLGHLNGLIGSWYFITGRYRQVWQLTRNHKETVR